MDFYYLNDTNQPVGPMDLPAIRKLAEAGIVAGEVLVCKAGSEEWIPLSKKSSPSPESQAPKPLRTAPPARSPLPSRKYSAPPSQPEAQASMHGSDTGSVYPAWFPLASMIAGITAILASCVPVLSILLAAPALTLGILAIRQNVGNRKPIALTGVATAGVAMVVSLGVLGLGGGLGGNPGNQYIGSWQIDLSIPIMMAQMDHSVMVTFDGDGRFTEVTGVQVSGANYNTGEAMRIAGGGKTTGYWEWDPKRKAIVTRHDGRNVTAYMDGENSDGRRLHTGGFDGGPSTNEAGEQFWIFKPDPNNANALIGEHPTMYRNRSMRFHRLN